ncbi:hypothetical protein HPB48_024970 [Haemaphysalis longicornis]|uniref:Uncharacterized protein n=1 Tax=Haemaphysalis longicornis TaxID=44386 RepID=A0A9J6H9P2_HAELO|nr:hypothetical protein HPB48_024970 [Haemaphysalis longicornis]
MDTGELTTETHAALRLTCYPLVQLCRYCFEELNFNYVLLGKFQTDSLEERFGQYRRLSGQSRHNPATFNSRIHPIDVDIGSYKDDRATVPSVGGERPSRGSVMFSSAPWHMLVRANLCFLNAPATSVCSSCHAQVLFLS